MSQPEVFYGGTHAGGSVVLLARVATADGTLITPSDIGSAAYTVYRLQPCEHPDRVAMVGHDGAALSPSVVLFASTQTAAPWTADATGYNFRHEVDATSSPPFPDPGREYLVRYELTPVVGQPIVFTFQIETL